MKSAVKKSLKPFFEAAIDNVIQFGDTDIFPFPIENHFLFDRRKEIISLLRKTYSYFDKCFNQHLPSHISTLAPVGISGFRWATQQDPFWNVFFLGITLSTFQKIEENRIPVEKNVIFSYRLDNNFLNGKLFREDVSWRDFINHSIDSAKKCKFVVMCDIADCYQRIYHHRLQNALGQLYIKNSAPKQIMEILQNFSNTKSYGLPIGGPAARILVELVLNLTDQILKSHQVQFCRYADDYHIFVSTIDEAYEKLHFISEKFLRNDGLALQKSKTRIMSSAEFIATQSPLISLEEEDSSDARKLFALRLRFDPYSANAQEEYDELRAELKKLDILGLLNLELAKTRIHGVLTKKLVAAVRYLDSAVKENAILTLLANLDNLYPIFPAVAITIKSCFHDISEKAQKQVCRVLQDRIIQKSFLLGTALHAAYTVRILSEQKSSENSEALVTLYNRFPMPLVRRDVILTMAKWQEFPWLSDQINEFQGASPWEKRAFIIASFFMGDAGNHWRDHAKTQFNPFELLIRDWAAEKVQKGNWNIPL